MRRIHLFLGAMVLGIAACGSDDGKNGTPADAIEAAEAGPDAAPDPVTPGDVPEAADDVPATEADAPDPGDVPAETGDDVPVTPDVPHELPPLVLKPPLATPADPLKGTGIESCATYLEERCEAGKLRKCGVYDPAAKAFVAEPDPLLKRVLLWERWRDLYSTADGMTTERTFNVATPPGTPESEWSKPERFASHQGMGDSGIWTGWTVIGRILRYAQTGTEADYERMEDGVRTLLAMYDVSGVPGYFIRYFFLNLEPGSPNTPDHLLRWFDETKLSHHYRDVDPAALAGLPAIYRDGITDAEGKVWKGRPMWQGRPSIDQNTGPMNALPMAWAMLRDETLKERISHHLTCYLKRLQRIELVNLQQNPELASALMQFFNAGELKLDPGDIDLLKIDKIVGYVQRQINTANEATFDKTCPATVQYAPWRVVDAAAPDFLIQLLGLVNDMDTSAGGENQIDHYYFPNLRGGDAVHLIHLAAMAYWFTGDEQYRTFLFDEVIGNLRGIEVAATAGAFDQSKFCSHFFGDQLTYGSWWVLLGMLEDSELKTALQQSFHDEMWDKLLKTKGNADFYIMYAGEVPDEIAKGKAEALAYALPAIRGMGGNGWVDGTNLLDDPRRSYTLKPDFVMEHAPEGIEAVCPTEAEYKSCTTEIVYQGLKIPGQNLLHDYECAEPGPWDCKLPNGRCTEKMTNLPLPVQLRQYTDWLWQRNPFELNKGVGLEGGVQMPGADLSEPYWNARRYGFVTEGAGQVLAWETTATDCGE
ncbi:MAG: hypothetical protein FJ087_20520 [Deltaproteobacteria bacterium]|nr:hypothetical protein [Deltaproteobacteria bacterium]